MQESTYTHLVPNRKHSKRSHSSSQPRFSSDNNRDSSTHSLPERSIGTRIKIYSRLGRNGLESRDLSRDSSNESLERIHTFQLKSSYQDTSKPKERLSNGQIFKLDDKSVNNLLT